MDKRDVNSELAKADTLAKQGDLESAVAILVQVLTDNPAHVPGLTMISRIYRAMGKLKDGVDVLLKLSSITPSDPWIWYDLGECYDAVNDFEHAADAYLKAWELNRKNARFALNAGYAFWHDNKLQEALEIWSLGSDIDPLVRAAQFRTDADNVTREKSRTADTELRRHFTQMYLDGLGKYDMPKRLSTAIWPQTHFGSFNYEIENQKPYMFYAPDLPPSPVFDVSKIQWAKSLNRATAAIKNELRTYLERTKDYGSPYLAHMSDGEESWRSLQGSENWNALHLYKDAQKQECAIEFPKTLAALDQVPMVEMFGTPMEIFFSVLKPGTHIPPHFGLSNSRCTAHLPLIIPDDCEIRVSDHVHHWREGELFLFDDSFDHEARNDSKDIRIVLIFETWRPDLSAIEINALQDSMETRASWLNNRKVPEIKEIKEIKEIGGV